MHSDEQNCGAVSRTAHLLRIILHHLASEVRAIIIIIIIIAIRSINLVNRPYLTYISPNASTIDPRQIKKKKILLP